VAALPEVSHWTVEAQMRSVLADDGGTSRRVLAVLAHLETHARR